tara:strand:+ start:6884 stop:7099 length:216 start_codon:yes stop_codon:yes gene_type:complete
MFDSSNNLYTAATSHFEARRDEAIAVLELYFENSVGIGDHSNVLSEITKWTTILAEAEECLKILEEHSEKC